MRPILLFIVYLALLPHELTTDTSNQPSLVDFMIEHTIDDYVIVLDSFNTDLVNEQIISQHNPVIRQIYTVEKFAPSPPLDDEFYNLTTLAETAEQWFVIAVQSTRTTTTTTTAPTVMGQVTTIVQQVNRNRNACLLFLIDSDTLMSDDVAVAFLIHVLTHTTPVHSIVYLHPLRLAQSVHLDAGGASLITAAHTHAAHDTITTTALLDFVSVHIVAPRSIRDSRHPDTEPFQVQGEELWLAELLAGMLNKTTRHIVLDRSQSPWTAVPNRFTDMHENIYQTSVTRLRPHLPQFRSTIHRSYNISAHSAHINLDLVYQAPGFRTLYPHRAIGIVLIVPNDRLYSVRLDTLAIGALVLIVYPLAVGRLRLAAAATTGYQRQRRQFQRLWLDTFGQLLAVSADRPAEGRRAAHPIDSFLWLFTAALSILNGTIVCCFLFEANAIGARYRYDTLADVQRDRLTIYGHAVHYGLNATELESPQVLNWLCDEDRRGALVFTDAAYAMLNCMLGVGQRRMRALPRPLAQQEMALTIAAPAAVELGGALKVALMRAVQHGFVQWFNRCNWPMVRGWERLMAQRREQRRRRRRAGGFGVADDRGSSSSTEAQEAQRQWSMLLAVLAAGATMAAGVFGVELRQGRRRRIGV